MLGRTAIVLGLGVLACASGVVVTQLGELESTELHIAEADYAPAERATPQLSGSVGRSVDPGVAPSEKAANKPAQTDNGFPITTYVVHVIRGEDRPVPDLEIALWQFRPAPQRLGGATTDKEGVARFRAPACPAPHYCVEDGSLVLDLVQGPTYSDDSEGERVRTLTLRVADGPYLGGRVADALSGSPIRDVLVFYEPMWGMVKTNHEGRFAYPREYAKNARHLFVKAPGYMATWHQMPPRVEGRKWSPIDPVLMIPGRPIEGRVIDSEGKPVRARVYVTEHGEACTTLTDLQAKILLARRYYGHEEARLAERVSFHYAYQDLADVETNPDGTFVTPEIEVGRAVVLFVAPRGKPPLASTTINLVISQGRAPIPVTIPVKKPRRIEVVLSGTRGQSAIIKTRAPGWSAEQKLEAGNNRTLIDLPHGPALIQAATETHTSLLELIDVQGLESGTIHLSLDRSTEVSKPRPVEGVVLDVHGAPMPNTRIHVHAPGTCHMDEGLAPGLVSDSAGRFTWHVERSGTYLLRAVDHDTKDELGPATEVREGSTDVVLRAGPKSWGSGWLRLRPPPGRELPGFATVSLWFAGERPENTAWEHERELPIVDGRILLEHLPIGESRVNMDIEGFARAKTPIRIEGEGPAGRLATVDLEPGYELTLHGFDMSGQIIKDLYYRSPDADFAEEKENGVVRLRGIRAGSIQLHIYTWTWPDEYRFEPRRITVDASLCDRLDIQFVRARNARGRVHLPIEESMRASWQIRFEAPALDLPPGRGFGGSRVVVEDLYAHGRFHAPLGAGTWTAYLDEMGEDHKPIRSHMLGTWEINADSVLYREFEGPK